MALLYPASLPFSLAKTLPMGRKPSFLATKSFNFNLPSPIQCSATIEVSNQPYQTINLRRSANYKPSIWSYDYLQSLTTKYEEESYTEQNRVLKEQIRMMLCEKANDQVDQLGLIDVLERLGVAYHFDNEIRNILDDVYSNATFDCKKKDLYVTALEFRLLRQHGYNLSTDIFDSFLDERGNFKKCEYDDVEGMLALYEASFLSFEDETILDEVRNFTTNFLKEYVSNNNRDNHISLHISHALELPLHWRLQRWEHEWFINVYERRHNMIPTLLQFAKLDFNKVQTIHLEELKYASRWWKRIGLAEKLSFFRDRLMENYAWSTGLNFMPDFGYFRRVMTKVNGLITTIDDIYDVYGTLEELDLFTEAVDRWDLNIMDSLPEYMKICFLALYNFVNETYFETLEENGHNITPYLKKAWADLCKSYLIEAKWCYSGYKPSLGEYLENAWISISTPVVLSHAFFSIPDSFKKEDLVYLENYHNIIRCSGMIFRLANDLAVRESEANDVPKSIQCYMNESGASEADARDHVKSIMSTWWKKMNQQVHECSNLPKNFVDMAVNLGRTAICFYQFGDGYTAEDQTKSRILSSIIQPIPVAGTKELLKENN